MASMSLHKRITVNSLSNAFRYFVFVCFTFVLTPFIIRSIGDSMYGLWFLILSLIGYAGIFEMGIQSAMIKLVAEHSATEDSLKVNETVSTAFVFFAAVGAVVALLCWTALPFALGYFIEDAGTAALGKKLAVVLGADVIAVFLMYVFTGMIYGKQRYHLKNIIDIVVTGVYALLIYFALSGGRGIYALVVVKTATDFAALAAFYFLCRSVDPGFTLSVGLVSRDSFRRLFSLGSRIFTSATMARIANGAEPAITSYYLSNAWTSVFAIPKRLLSYTKEITWALATGFTPVFSELQGKNDFEAIRSIYINYTRYILLAVLPGLAVMFVYGVPFIAIWIGQEFADKGGVLLYLLTLSFFFDTLQPLILRMFIGIGKVGFPVKVYTLASIIYILSSIVAVQAYGINGMGACALAVSAVTQLILIWHVSGFLGMGSLSLVTRSMFLPVSLSLLYGGGLFMTSKAFAPATYLSILAQNIIAAPFYGAMVFFIALSRDERRFVVDKARAILGGLQKREALR